ncbi:MAG TPA: ROK family protein [Burkholderiales bacterium]|nr:ROK family protein [Burkholderiales bacterium]
MGVSALTKDARKNGKARLQRILAIDIGGSKVKLLATGSTEPRKFESGSKLTPAKMIDKARKEAKGWDYDAVSIGLPAMVGPNGPLAEPGNLGHGWVGFDYAAAFGCPVRMANDAAMQALGSYDGGRMLFIGFGTGLGSALIADHIIIPLELGDLQFEDGTYSELLGRDSFDRLGKKAWRKLALEAIPPLQKALLADYVVVGGGNAKHLGKKLPPNVRIGNNLTAFRGGFRLWGLEEVQTLQEAGTEHQAPPARPSNGDWRIL